MFFLVGFIVFLNSL